LPPGTGPEKPVPAARLPGGYLKAIEALFGDGGAVSSAGEHYLDMVGAIGSIPIPPTTFNVMPGKGIPLCARNPDTAVREKLCAPIPPYHRKEIAIGVSS
jgi:hypothetical protein